MAKLDARSILIILASFGLVAGTLILVQKRNGPPEVPSASGPQAIAAPPSAPIELLGSTPAPAPVTAPLPAPAQPAPVSVAAPVPAPASSAAHHAIPAESSVPAPANPIGVASSTKPASVAAPKSVPATSAATHHAIPAESEPAPASAAKASTAKGAVQRGAFDESTSNQNNRVKPASTTATPVKPAPAPTPVKSAPKPAAKTSHYFLQAGAFKDENNAQKLIAKLKAAGFTATESTVGELHKVLVGPYHSPDAAAAAKIKLKAKGFDSAFVAKS